MSAGNREKELRHRKVTKQDSRQTNLHTTLELVSRHGASSRAEIARRTGLSRAAVSSLVSELMDTGLLREMGQGKSAGGKPPTLLALNERARDIVAVDLGHHPFQGALIDLTGHIHERVAAHAAEQPPTGERALEMAVEMVESLVERSVAPVLGIGIGSPGVIAPDGRVLEASNLAWHGLDLGEAMRANFDFPITVANDAAMAALAEFRRHPVDRHLILVKLGRGIGAGLVLSGDLYRGQHSAAGEIGHVRVVDDGDTCGCGRVGCLETIASVPAILKSLDAEPDHLPWDALALTGIYGEAKVRSALSRAGTAVGAALAGVVATLDVGRVILASELRNADDVLVEAVAGELYGRILPSTADLIEVESTRSGSDLVLEGAASAVLVDSFGAVL